MATKKTHGTLPGSNRPKAPGTVKVRDVDPKEKMDVTGAFAGPKLPGPNEMVGERLTPQEFASRFSASKADADKVTKSLKKFGLKVEEVSYIDCASSVKEKRATIKIARHEIKATDACYASLPSCIDPTNAHSSSLV